MRAIKITKRFPGKFRHYQPGLYLVPEDMDQTQAKLATVDGYGHQAEATDQAEVDGLVADFRKRSNPGRKGPAPEDKSGGSAPENKSKMEGSPPGSGSGTGSQPGGARSLTTRTAVQRGGAGGK